MWLMQCCGICNALVHDDVIKWKHVPRYWPFVRGMHRSPVNSPHKGQWRGALVFSLICVWIHDWVNNHEAGDLRRYRAHCDVTVMNRGTVLHGTSIQLRMYNTSQGICIRWALCCGRPLGATLVLLWFGTVKHVHNDHLMGYFSAFWSSRPPRWTPEGRNC